MSDDTYDMQDMMMMEKHENLNLVTILNDKFSPEVLVQSSTEQMEDPPPPPQPPTTNPDLELLFPTSGDFLLLLFLMPTTSSSSRTSMRCVMKWFVWSPLSCGTKAIFTLMSN